MKYILYTCRYMWNEDGAISAKAISEDLETLIRLGDILTLGEQKSFHIYIYNDKIYHHDRIINRECKEIQFNKINYLKYLNLDILPKKLYYNNNHRDYIDSRLLNIFHIWLCNFYFTNNESPSKTTIYKFINSINHKTEIKYIDSISKLLYSTN